MHNSTGFLIKVYYKRPIFVILNRTLFEIQLKNDNINYLLVPFYRKQSKKIKNPDTATTTLYQGLL